MTRKSVISPPNFDLSSHKIKVELGRPAPTYPSKRRRLRRLRHQRRRALVKKGDVGVVILNASKDIYIFSTDSNIIHLKKLKPQNSGFYVAMGKLSNGKLVKSRAIYLVIRPNGQIVK